jgi:hypothetical protein
MPPAQMLPEQQYLESLRDREAQLADLNRLHSRLGGARLGIGALFLFGIWLCFGVRVLPAAWLLLPPACFAGAVVYHQRVETRRARLKRAVAFNEEGIARIRDEWHGSGPSGGRYADPHHIYAADLDLFTDAGLFQLLCAARTPMGERTLAQWLLAPAEPAEISRRHACIADLRGRLELREEWATLGEPPSAQFRPEYLIAWADSASRLDRTWLRWTAPLLACLGLAAAITWSVTGWYLPLLVILVVESLLVYRLKDEIHAVISVVEQAFEHLRSIAALLARLEAEPFEAAPLRALVQSLARGSAGASTAIAQLTTIVNFVESRRNPLLAPVLLLFMYPLQVAIAAERWRSRHGRSLGAWLQALGEFEAVSSLARHAYEHPQDTLPEFCDGPPRFEAAALGHPLIPAVKRICNDVRIAGDARVLLVSGSNMSGKSTLLRTVGINTVLAMAGAPVRARRLLLTPLQVGASICVQDSLREGSSRFYAEITRLRQLFEPAARPMLFLLDELLQGTNSADRRLGAEGVIRAFVERGAIGLFSTHDLALTDLAGLGPGVLVNMHFEDELRDGVLHFDFRLRQGVVTKSNAIELMRSIGLEV